jgi:hypothetical protein
MEYFLIGGKTQVSGKNTFMGNMAISLYESPVMRKPASETIRQGNVSLAEQADSLNAVSISSGIPLYRKKSKSHAK